MIEVKVSITYFGLEIIIKGKARPITGHEDPEGGSSTLSLTSALDVGGWSTPRPGRFTPG